MRKMAKDDDEILTDVLAEDRWWAAIRSVLTVLESLQISSVDIEFGFVVDRDIEGKRQGEDRTIPLNTLVSTIELGLTEGTIERSGVSDFFIRVPRLILTIMLCNDGDIHFGSRDKALLKRIADELKGIGIVVHGPPEIVG